MTPVPPFRPQDKILCIKESNEVNLDNTPLTILGVDENGVDIDIQVGSICIVGNAYNVDCCIWSPHTGWIVVIRGEFHKADCFQLV